MNVKYFLQGLILLLALNGCRNNGHEILQANEVYRCPMHPEITQSKPGNCPVCKMALVKTDVSSDVRRLMFTDQQLLLANVKTITVRTGLPGRSVTLNGKITLNQDRLTTISSRVSGRINRLFVREKGQEVRLNQPLYELYSEQLQTLEREYLASLSNPELAEAAASKLILLGLTKSQIQQLKSKNEPEPNIVFLSPVSGFVESLPERNGVYVNEGDELYRIGQRDHLWVEASAYPPDDAQISKGSIVSVSVNGTKVTGAVLQINPEIKKGSQIRVLRIAIRNPGKAIVPGLPVSVDLPLPGIARSMILIPSGAVIHGKAGDHVWIQEDDGSFRKQSIDRGEAGSGYTAVRNGLVVGDHLVVSGTQLLDGAAELSIN